MLFPFKPLHDCTAALTSYTNSTITRRPNMAAARSRLERVMSFFGSSRRSTCVGLVFSSAAIRDFDILCFFMAWPSCHATTSLIVATPLFAVLRPAQTGALLD